MHHHGIWTPHHNCPDRAQRGCTKLLHQKQFFLSLSISFWSKLDTVRKRTGQLQKKFSKHFHFTLGTDRKGQVTFFILCFWNWAKGKYFPIKEGNISNNAKRIIVMFIPKYRGMFVRSGFKNHASYGPTLSETCSIRSRLISSLASVFVHCVLSVIRVVSQAFTVR